jgi:hypothetical protein
MRSKRPLITVSQGAAGAIALVKAQVKSIREAVRVVVEPVGVETVEADLAEVETVE